MSVGMVTAIVILSFFLLIMLGLPVAFCLITSSVIYILVFWTPTALYCTATTIFNQSTKDIFLAIPLFVFLATVLEKSGIAENLFDMFYKWIGRIRGGLSVGAVLMCTIMDAISGLGASGIVTVGPIALPEMLKRRYSKRLSTGCIAAGSALGPLIPPSVVMIIIAGFTGLSVGRLFAAGLFPGFLCAAVFALYILIICKLKPQMGPAIPKDIEISWRDRIKSLRAVVLPLLLILMVMGTIYTGVCTPTEGAAMGAFGALICAGVNRKLTLKNIYSAGKSSLAITCMVMWLLIGGSMFATLINAIGIQGAIADFLGSIHNHFGSSAMLIVIMFIVFVMGMFIDGAAITVLTMPVFFPIIVEAGIEPIWFATLFTMNIIIGYLTPPFGMNLFYTKGIAPPEVSMSDIYLSILPFVGAAILVLIAVFAIPEIATWFPDKIMGAH
ncbi:MAG: TRAP transporter large permease subunit [Desulfobacterales bacterium]|nr:TRAP transporter large permease subunit [Desulfobacterales bacterium]